MYTPQQIENAAAGKAGSQKGLNLGDVDAILSAAGLSTAGSGPERRARLQENLNKCLACQGLVADEDESPTSKLDTSTDTAKSEEATPQSTLYL